MLSNPLARAWSRCLPRRRAAFTLIELLVVMALILVISALGIGYEIGRAHV